jgi:hypothetical protein
MSFFISVMIRRNKNMKDVYETEWKKIVKPPHKVKHPSQPGKIFTDDALDSISIVPSFKLFTRKNKED